MALGTNRTKMYIVADFDSDKDAVDQLCKWKGSDYWSLSFKDVHKLTQSRDSSLYCTIKRSLKERMDVSKTFVLIVGDGTNSVTKGSCQYCPSYNSLTKSCAKGYSADYRSYIKYECDEAVVAGIKIVVIYKASTVDKSKCPDAVRGSRHSCCNEKALRGLGL